MASFTTKINEFLHSPKTREMVDKAKAAANKPENRQKIKQIQEKITSRARGHGQRPGAAPPASPARQSDHPGGSGADQGYAADHRGSGHGSDPGSSGQPGYGDGPGAGQGYGAGGSTRGYDADVAPGSWTSDPGSRPER
jgi:hypothetical protein